MRTVPEIVSSELNRVPSRKKAVIFYDSQNNGSHSIKVFLSALQEAGLEQDFEVCLFNLNTLEARATSETARVHTASASVILFAVDQLPSEQALEWIDSWSDEAPSTASLLVLLNSETSPSPDDHALVCSYFRAVAMRGLRHYNCGTCRCHLPAAPLPAMEFPTETLKARIHASIACMNLPVPQMA